MSNHTPLPKMTVAYLQKVKASVDVRGPDECWPWTGRPNREYGQISLGGKQYGAHRLAYFIAFGVDPGDLCVCHSCDNPPCCNPAHLFLGTVGDNNRDMVAKGRHSKRGGAQGGKHPDAKLTEKDVREIRQSRETHQALAEQYGVGVTTLASARKRETWKHVERQEGDYQPGDYRSSHRRECKRREDGYPRNPKLTEKDVREIRQSNEACQPLAEKYGVNAGTIYRIKSGKSWKNVK